MDVVRDPALVQARGSAPKSRRRVRIGVALFALAALVAGYWGWSAWSSPGASATQYVTAVAQRGNLEDAVTATGTLQPRDYVDVGTQVSGQLKKLHVEVGSQVKAGQMLAEIDPTLYRSRVDADRAQLLNLRAQLTDRQAQLALAEQQFSRQTNLMREQATTRDALQTAEANLASAKAQIDVLNAQIQQASSTLRGDEASLSYTRIYAPMNGTVVSQNAKQGQTLNANQQAPIIVRIADLSTMTVQSQVSEADVARLKVGMDVYFTTLGEPERRWYGTLRQINPTPEIVNNVVLYNALFDVANSDGALMTQMTAQIFFVVAQAQDALIVPLSALRPAEAGPRGSSARAPRSAAQPKDGTRPAGASQPAARAARNPESPSVQDPRTAFRDGRARVRVLAGDGAIAWRDVQVGVMNRVSAQIVSGLEAGERVVTGQRSAAPPAAASSGSGTGMMPRGRL
jgi:macrolide-specific efflux system membrane fusion protein